MWMRGCVGVFRGGGAIRPSSFLIYIYMSVINPLTQIRQTKQVEGAAQHLRLTADEMAEAYGVEYHVSGWLRWVLGLVLFF